MPTAPILAAAVAVIVNESKMLVQVAADGSLELPGLILGHSEEVLRSIEELVQKLDVGEGSQQMLYLRSVPSIKSQKKPYFALVRVIHVEAAKAPSFPEGRYEALSKLQSSDRASSLVDIVTRWITRNFSD